VIGGCRRDRDERRSLWGGAKRRVGAAKANARIPRSWKYPHPAHRSLRSRWATLPTSGRDEDPDAVADGDPGYRSAHPVYRLSAVVRMSNAKCGNDRGSGPGVTPGPARDRSPLPGLAVVSDD